MNYNCELCNFNTTYNGKYERHINTKKHKQLMITNESKLYNCEICNFKNSKNNKYDYTCHLSTKKHMKNISIENNNIVIKQDSTMPPIELDNPCIETKNTNDAMNKLIKQNEIIIQNQTDILNKMTNSQQQIIHNTTHTTFNLNVFLNETCKEAITIEDFMKNMVISDELTRDFIEKGYVDGITNIIKSNLIKYSVSKRPMHCSDIKRQKIYLKCNDGWVHDEDMKNTLSVISKTKMRNFKKIHTENNVSKITDLDSSEYIIKSKILREAMGGTNGSSLNYLEKQDEKVIKKILNIISIDRCYN